MSTSLTDFRRVGCFEKISDLHNGFADFQQHYTFQSAMDSLFWEVSMIIQTIAISVSGLENINSSLRRVQWERQGHYVLLCTTWLTMWSMFLEATMRAKTWQVVRSSHYSKTNGNRSPLWTRKSTELHPSTSRKLATSMSLEETTLKKDHSAWSKSTASVRIPGA